MFGHSSPCKYAKQDYFLNEDLSHVTWSLRHLFSAWHASPEQQLFGWWDGKAYCNEDRWPINEWQTRHWPLATPKLWQLHQIISKTLGSFGILWRWLHQMEEIDWSSIHFLNHPVQGRFHSIYKCKSTMQNFKSEFLPETKMDTVFDIIRRPKDIFL